MKRQLITFILLQLPTLVLAAENGNEVDLLTPALKMVGALGVIIGLLLLIYAASRKGFGFLPKQREGSIKILETKPLGGKKFLCLVSVRGEEMLLGMSNDRIECLNKFSKREDFSATLQQQLEEDAK
ncbi:Flagellar biosynthesis protein, FliO [Malonomonas rubra DSM 5091]|uniref:Flagellar biosynthesis protein, FliO n=1 Tax=Malonomonas rubra DSM 5091 TaxID=1122189 RepID=A0A1M6MC37_MALRU|nr:flagellar biosynthetic protein FliO [Malonomonas rubra]SHJ80979.1 Flagellar biosynthesis protein, FliO [Malonomonas rubra DSM 5091]